MAEQALLGAVDGIFHQDGLATVRLQGNNGNGRLEQVCQLAKVGQGVGGKILQVAVGAGVHLPPGQGFENQPAAGELAHVNGEVVNHFTVQFIGGADLDLSQPIQHIQLGDGEAINPIHLDGIAANHAVKLTALAAPFRGGAEFTASVGEVVV